MTQNHYQKKKTTIRLTQEDEELLDKLGQALAYKLGRAGQASQSDVIRYSIRRIAELELNSAESKGKQTNG